MRRFLLAMFLALGLGCASTPKGRAIQIVVASDAAADEISGAYENYVEAKVAECGEMLDPEVDTKEDAMDCLGMASSSDGERLLKLMETLVQAQLMVKIAVECESNPLKVPREFMAQCIDGQGADWRALTMSLTSAWADLAPFLEAIRGFTGEGRR